MAFHRASLVFQKKSKELWATKARTGPMDGERVRALIESWERKRCLGRCLFISVTLFVMQFLNQLIRWFNVPIRLCDRLFAQHIAHCGLPFLLHNVSSWRAAYASDPSLFGVVMVVWRIIEVVAVTASDCFFGPNPFGEASSSADRIWKASASGEQVA